MCGAAAVMPFYRLAVAAANPCSLNACVDSVTQLQVVLDVEEWDQGSRRQVKSHATKAVMSASESQGKAGPAGTTHPGRRRPDKDSVQGGNWKDALCWDCGQKGHRRNRCPQHFRFKPASAPGERPENADVENRDAEMDAGTPISENGVGSSG